MSRFDVNCMVGHWPFRKLRHNKPEDILNTHKKNGFTGGCISSLQSVLYNDPYEADQDLSTIVEKMGYVHIQSVNPMLSFTLDDIKRGRELLGTKGVKIYPGTHGYDFNATELEPLCKYLQEQDIPLFVQLRMEDYWTDYLLLQKQFVAKDIEPLLKKYPDCRVILLSARLNEIIALASIVKETDNVLFDTSGLKDSSLFSIEKIVDAIGPDKLAYGSLYPLLCLKSSLLWVEKAQLPETIKEKILSQNAKGFLRFDGV